jgi:cyclic pyranopterin phosphate synthase
MTDTTDHPIAPRQAIAEAEVAVSQATLSAIIDGNLPKGDVLAVAEVAGVMAGKHAGDLIPLCHSVVLTDLLVRATPDRAGSVVRIKAEAAALAVGGVEMAALTAATVAALTVFDMIKEMEPGATIRSARLVSACGGEAEWRRPDEPRPEGHAPAGARAAGRVVPGILPRRSGGLQPGRRRSP